MWIRTQDKEMLLDCSIVFYEEKQRYSEKFKKLKQDVTFNYRNYINQNTNRLLESYEVNGYLEEHKEIETLHNLYGVDNFLLGTYGTKQRALEVLEEIQEHIETRVVADNMMIKLFNTSDLGEEELRKKMRKLSCVYVMPKE